MAGHLLIKSKVKKVPKRLGRAQRHDKQDLDGFINLLDTLKKKLRGQKARRLYYGDKSPVKKPKRVDNAELFEKLRRLTDELAGDDEDLLENCHRLAEKFAKLKINKRADDAGLWENDDKENGTFAVPKINKDLQSKAEEDDLWIETSCVSLNADEDESEHFFKACQRSAKKMYVQKIFKDSRSEEDWLNKQNPVIESKSNRPTKIINIDLTDNVPDIVPKPLGQNHVNLPRKTHERLVIVTKKLEENTEKTKIVNKLAENSQENAKPAEKNKEKHDIVPNPLGKQTEKLQIVLKALQKNPEKLQIISKPLQKNPEKLQIVAKPLQKKTVTSEKVLGLSEENLRKLEVALKPLEKKPEKVKIVETGTQGIKDFRFSSVEKKKVGKYNSNIFNPTGNEYDDPGETRGQPKPNKRNIIIDGSNVAYAHSRSIWFSSEGLQYCLQYFDRMGHDVKAVVPLFRRNAFQSSNPQLLDELYLGGKIVFTPCKNFLGQKSVSYDDRFILQLAYEWNAAVVSNDNYRDVIDESPSFKLIVETRVLGYTWCDNIFILPKDPYGRWGPTLDEILHF